MFKKEYNFKDGIYVYPFSDKTVDKIQNFYRDDPFPNYEFNDDRTTIQKRGDLNSYTHELKKFIGYGKKIISTLISKSRDIGIKNIFIETGSGKFFEPARKLFKSCSFEECDPFGHYKNDPNSCYMKIKI